jgi:Cysteine-rich CWC
MNVPSCCHTERFEETHAETMRHCGLPVECAVPAVDCRCMSVPAWEGALASVHKKYADCLCKTCLSLSFFSPSTFKNAWGIR